MKNKKSMMNLAISNLFLVFLGAGLVIPVLPTLKEQMHFSGTTMGMMISIFAIAQLVASPVAGALSDKIGRKKLIAIGMIIFSFSELLFGLAQAKTGFYISRALGGVAAAMLMPSVTAYVADMTTIAERPKAMGLVSAAISGGFIIGPGVGGFIAHFGIRVPFYVAAILAFLGFILTITILREPERTIESHQEIEKVSFLDILKNPLFGSLFIIILISSFGLQAFESIYSIMASINFGFSMSEIALVITVSGILALFFQLFLFDAIVNKIGALSTFVVFLAFDLFRPAVTTYLSKHAGNRQGAINGLNSAFTSFGNILGPMAAGYMFDLNHLFPYYISAIILLGTGFLSLFLNRKNFSKI